MIGKIFCSLINSTNRKLFSIYRLSFSYFNFKQLDPTIPLLSGKNRAFQHEIPFYIEIPIYRSSYPSTFIKKNNKSSSLSLMLQARAVQILSKHMTHFTTAHSQFSMPCYIALPPMGRKQKAEEGRRTQRFSQLE